MGILQKALATWTFSDFRDLINTLDTRDLSIYRPISNLNMVSKVLEATFPS